MAIYRLKFTKERASSHIEKYDELQALMNSENGYKNYRSEIINCIPPCIPHIGVFLQDLTFIEDGNPDMVDLLINFHKRRMVYKSILTMNQFQQSPYNLTPVEIIKEYITNKIALCKDVPDEKLFALSNEFEPKDWDGITPIVIVL